MERLEIQDLINGLHARINNRACSFSEQMAYLEIQDLIDELGDDVLVQLTDNDLTGEINEARIWKAIEYAQSIFDSHARARYAIPVPVTPLVRSVNLDLAVFHLMKSRSTIEEGVYKIRKNANDDAIKTLLNIGSGKAALDVPTAQETITNPATTDKILTNAGRSKFTDGKLSRF